MKNITEKIIMYYRYDDRLYKVSDRKQFRIGDIFIDGRNYSVNIIEDEQDIIDMSYVAPELYVILEEIIAIKNNKE